MADFRESSAVIREAELLAGTPDVAAAWVRERSSQPWYDHSSGDPQTETALLGMGSRLVELALARFGRNADVLRQLYGGGDLAMRVATLSNEPHLREVVFGPWEFTGAARDDFTWLGTLSQTEFEALFANPALPNSFISDFFEQKGAWVPLDDDRRQQAIVLMARHLESRREKDTWDGWASYTHSRVFDSAWQLSAMVPTTSDWAATLARLYNRLPAQTFSKFDPLSIATRWFPAEDDDRPWNDEEGYVEQGGLSYYQIVRAGLARLAASAPAKSPRTELLSDADVAVRCGACGGLRLDPQVITEAIARDGAAAAYGILENDSAWRTAKTREALQQACWSVPDPRSDMLLPRVFRRREEIIRQRFPGWFADDDLMQGDATETSLSADLAHLRQQIQKLNKLTQETRSLVLLALIAGAIAWYFR